MTAIYVFIVGVTIVTVLSVLAFLAYGNSENDKPDDWTKGGEK